MSDFNTAQSSEQIPLHHLQRFPEEPSKTSNSRHEPKNLASIGVSIIVITQTALKITNTFIVTDNLK